MGLKAVIFALEGVLIDTREIHYLSWKKIAERLMIPFTRWDNYRLPELTNREFLTVVLRGRQIPEDEIHELLVYKDEYVRNHMEQVDMQDLLPGIFALLWELHAAQVSIGVASTVRNTPAIISRLRINHHIEVICDAGSVAKLKPHPDVFLCAASLLDVDPENCMVIEDSATGIQAGLSAGMCVVGVGARSLTREAHVTFPGLQDVRLIDLQEAYAVWHAQMMAGESPVMPQPGSD